MHRIIVLERNIATREVLPTAEETWVGRSPDFAIPLRDRWVSRRHAVIRLKDGVLSIEDAGSTTGTILNGRRLRPGQSAPLHSGDVVICGTSTLVCQFDTHPSAAPADAGLSALYPRLARANARISVLARGAVRIWPIAACSILLGRDDACDIRIDEEGVTDKHARIAVTGEGFFIENGSPFPHILVNGECVRTTRIRSNSVIVLGLAQILFVYDHEPGGESASDPVDAIPKRAFLRCAARHARLAPAQIRRLRRARARSNVEVGEFGVRIGIFTPVFWSSICTVALEEWATRRVGVVSRILSWAPGRSKEKSP